MSNELDLPKVEKESIFVDPEVVRSIYQDLEVLSIELDEDPIQFGPRRLNGKVAQTRNMLSKCQKLFMMVSRLLWEVKTSITRDEVIIDMKTNDYLANDPDVRARPSVSDRKAMVQVLLKEEIQVLGEKKENFVNLQMLSETLKAKSKDLTDTQARLNSQIRLCKMEIESLGLKWGSKDPEVILELTPDFSTSGLKIDEFLLGEEEEPEIHLPPRPLLEEEVLSPPQENLSTQEPSLASVAQKAMSINLDSITRIKKEPDELEGFINGEEYSSDEEIDGVLDLLETSIEIEGVEEPRVEQDDLDEILNQL